jgi:hypothetical protein
MGYAVWTPEQWGRYQEEKNTTYYGPRNTLEEAREGAYRMHEARRRAMKKDLSLRKLDLHIRKHPGGEYVERVPERVSGVDADKGAA